MGERLRSLLSEVLLVPREDVVPGARLVEDLGAESIDVLDLVFRLEDLLGRTVTPTRFARYTRDHLARTGQGSATVETVMGFVLEELARAERGDTADG